MYNVKIINPETLAEAKELLSKRKEAKIIAGGTDLIPEIREKTPLETPETLINISSLKDLDYIEEGKEKIEIGSLTTHSKLSESAVINKYFSFLAKAAAAVGSPQIRNRGTIGGNLVNASPCADTVPVLVALGAEAKIISQEKTRTRKISRLIEGPYRISIKSDEILSSIIINKVNPESGTSYIKLARRNALAKSRINCAVLIKQDHQSIIQDIRICAGSITPVPIRMKEAENILLRKKPNEELIKSSAQKVQEKMIELSGYRWSTEYKKPVVKSLVERGIRNSLEGASWKK